jgi:5-keto 4-deoxyuronate isomerase
MVDAGMNLGKQGQLPTEMHHILLVTKDSVEDHPPSSSVHLGFGTDQTNL